MYCVATGRYACHNKYYGRSLDDSGFKSAIVEYLTGGGGDLRIDVLDRLMERLSELKGVLCELDTFRFYTSSLLITYDGGNGCNNAGCGAHLIPRLMEKNTTGCSIGTRPLVGLALILAVLHVSPQSRQLYNMPDSA